MLGYVRVLKLLVFPSSSYLDMSAYPGHDTIFAMSLSLVGNLSSASTFAHVMCLTKTKKFVFYYIFYVWLCAFIAWIGGRCSSIFFTLATDL